MAQNNLSIENCKEALAEIFTRFDSDKDNFLSLEDFNNFLLSSSSATYSQEQWNSILNTYKEEEKTGLSLAGFLKWHDKEISVDKVSVCKYFFVQKKIFKFFRKLRNSGFDHNFKLIQSNFEGDLKNIAKCMEKFTLEADEQIVAAMNDLWDRTGCESARFR